MKSVKLPLKNGKGNMNLFLQGDVEFVDPFVHFGEQYINMNVQFRLNHWEVDPQLPQSITREKVIEMAREEGFRDFRESLDLAETMVIPKGLEQVLTLRKKKRQLEAIRTVSLSHNLLMAFGYYLNHRYGYTYSFYSGTALPMDVDWADMPRAAYFEEDEGLEVWGETDLQAGKIKSIIGQQNRTFAKFYDKAKDWHCFVYTMAGINGRERGHGPHMHYLSNSFGYKRDQIVDAIRNGRYTFDTDNHIPYIRNE
jgi:hypothetical protein